MLKKEPKKKKNRESKKMKRKRDEQNDKRSNPSWKMILGLITLKHNLGQFILSFKTMNLGLHYVPNKSILIKHGYLDWRGFSLRSLFFVTNKVVISVLQPKNILVNYSLVRDEFWIFKCMMGQLKKKRMKKKMKNVTLERKPEKVV